MTDEAKQHEHRFSLTGTCINCGFVDRPDSWALSLFRGLLVANSRMWRKEKEKP